jgi:hypothetical protein
MLSPAQHLRKRWTRDEVGVLENSGLIAGQRLELIDGDLLEKAVKDRRYVNATTRVRLWMERVFGAESVECEALRLIQLGQYFLG